MFPPLMLFGIGVAFGGFLQSPKGRNVANGIAKFAINKFVIGDDAIGKAIKKAVTKPKQEKKDATSDK